MTPAIYFAGSIRGGRAYVERYGKIVERLKQHGTVLTEHVADPSYDSGGEDTPEDEIYERDHAKLKRADVLVAEVSTPSLGVGYEIGWFTEQDRPTICLYHEGSDHSLSAMVAGHPDLTVLRYQEVDAVLGPLMDELESL